MYPETDVPPVAVTEDRLARLRAELPELPSAAVDRFLRDYGLAPELVRQLVYGDEKETFEALAQRGHAPGVAARLLVHELPAVAHRPGMAPFAPTVDLLDRVLAAQESGRFAKEGLRPVLEAVADGAADVDAAIGRAGLGGFDRSQLLALVEKVVDAEAATVSQRGMDAFSALMGDVMKEVRGRRDGREVAEALRAAIARRIARPPPGSDAG